LASINRFSLDPVAEKVHQLASRQLVALAILLGIPYIFKVLVDEFPDVLAERVKPCGTQGVRMP
jgi:hypothetical protein